MTAVVDGAVAKRGPLIAVTIFLHLPAASHGGALLVPVLLPGSVSAWSLPVGSPYLCQLCLSAQLLRVIWAVLDSVGLMPCVVAYRTLINIECWADHTAIRVLQNVRCVDRLRLIVVLAENTK